MSMTDDGGQAYNEPIDGSGLTPAERRILQAKADKAQELEAEVDGLRRQISVRDAGITFSNEEQRKALEAVHTGEWTPEALRETAAKLGFAAQGAAPPIPADELAAGQRITDASKGGDQTQVLSAEQEFDAQMKSLEDEVRAGRMSPERADKELDRMYRASGRLMNEH